MFSLHSMLAPPPPGAAIVVTPRALALLSSRAPGESDARVFGYALDLLRGLPPSPRIYMFSGSALMLRGAWRVQATGAPIVLLFAKADYLRVVNDEVAAEECTPLSVS